MDSHAQQHLIAQRITYFRNQRGLNQQELSALMDFNQRQTLSDIERGARRVSVDEMQRFAEIFQVSPMVLLDAFVPALPVEFSWRTLNEPKALDAFEQRGRNLINLVTTLRSKLGKPPQRHVALSIGVTSSFEAAARAAEGLLRDFQLGTRPARQLSYLYQQLAIDCIHLDLPDYISGAAMVTDDALMAVVNANQVKGRRHFDMAHELFHCLTWRTMPPEHIDRVEVRAGARRSRVEQLADSFAGALLMPEQEVLKAVADRSLAIEPLIIVANDFEVSVDALIWRLVSLRVLTKAEASQLLKQPYLTGNGDPVNMKASVLLSQPLLILLAEAFKAGILSVRRAATILELPIDTLAEIYRQYDMAVPFDM